MQQLYPVFNPYRAAAVAALLRRNSVRADDPSQRTVDPSGRQLPVFRDAAQDAGAREYPVFNPPSGGELLSEVEERPRYLGTGAAHEAAHAAAPPAPPAPPAPDNTATGRQYPVYRPASQIEEDEASLRDLYSTQPKNTNSRGGGALRLAAYQASEEARQSDSLGRVAVAAAGGLVSGLVNKRADEQIIDRPRQIARAQARVALDEDALKQEGVEADIAYKRARPGIEQAKADAQARSRAQSLLMREIGNRAKDPRPFDPSDDYDADLVARARAAGVGLDVEGFGDNQKPLTMEVVDPADPSGTKKTRYAYDRAQRTWGPVRAGGQGVTTGYVQPVDPKTGMTSKQESDVAARDRAFEAAERRRAIQNEFRRQEVNLSAGRYKLAQLAQDNRFSEQARRELKQANDLEAEAERYQQAANDIGSRTEYTDPQTGEKKNSRKAENQRDLFAGRAASLRQKLFADYGYLFGGDDGHGPSMSASAFARLFPSLGGNYTGEAQRLGVQITDPNSMQGPVRQSPLPRRGAPRPPASSSQPSGRFAGRRMSRANLPAAAKALGVSTDEAERIITREGGVIY